MEGFNDLFIEYYQGTQVQAKVRENLYTGKFDKNYGNSREEYAMKRNSISRYLEPQMSDEDIIKYVARHFATEISRVIAIQGINTVDRLLEYLRRIDDLKPIRRNKTFRNNQVRFGKPSDRQVEKKPWQQAREAREKNGKYPDGGETKYYERKKQERRSHKTEDGYRKNWKRSNYEEKEQERKRHINYVERKNNKTNKKRTNKDNEQTKRDNKPNLDEIRVDIEPTSQRKDFC